MSVETVETETVAPAVSREPLSVETLRNLRGTPAIRVADETNPDDETLDRWMVLDNYREDARSYGDGDWTNGRFSGYEIVRQSSGELGVGGHDGDWHDARRILESAPGSYNDYFRVEKMRNSVGMFGAVYYDHLPREMRRLSTDGWPHTSNAMFEVLAVDMAANTATVRLFAYGPTPDADFTELGEHTALLDHLNRASIMNKESFDKAYGLAKNVMPEGMLFERIQDGEMWQVTGHSYTQVKIKRVDNDGKVYGRHTVVSLSDLDEGNTRFVKLGDSWNEYLLSQPSGETAEMLAALSKVTVSKALKHADSNGYCSETAVALASAGHSLPELRIKGTITLNVDVSTKEYMVLRRLMGATDGNPDLAVANMFGNKEEGIAPNLSLYNRLQQEAHRVLPAIPDTGSGENSYDLKAELVWKAPRIRK
jgi:hypothetical protein